MEDSPQYTQLSKRDWELKFSQAREILQSCRMCPHACGVNRLAGEVGLCGSAVLPVSGEGFPHGFAIEVASATLHSGEEPVLCGAKGIGNFFFTHCNSRCLFCQNWEISQPRGDFSEEGSSRRFTPSQLAEKMVVLQSRGASHIGLVSPSHMILFLLEAIRLAVGLGLRIPIVYNSNGYDGVETLRVLEGIVSIYLPDFKYGDDSVAMELSGLRDYGAVVQNGIREMVRQVGAQLWVEDGLAVRGVIVRHLVLPGGIAHSRHVFQFLGEEISTSICVSLMAQYYPTFRALGHPLLKRSITHAEYAEAIGMMGECWLFNGWIQELRSQSFYCPDFSNGDNPFVMGSKE